MQEKMQVRLEKEKTEKRTKKKILLLNPIAKEICTPNLE
jgi:hypothetical protein